MARLWQADVIRQFRRTVIAPNRYMYGGFGEIHAHRWLEEVIVWMQTVQYLPLRGSAEFLGHGAIVGALILGAWRLSLWLFGP